MAVQEQARCGRSAAWCQQDDQYFQLGEALTVGALLVFRILYPVAGVTQLPGCAKYLEPVFGPREALIYKLFPLGGFG